ncbi:potassium channel family protein [Maioricimonas rarisocia]|uniref:potassium channel family protein n=1 Tax=Maioricimonas rarisocia TaxID=2528026 RepID=UPI0018D211EE|nr:potassium channel family protein [Maioricimonas rarisocia]
MWPTTEEETTVSADRAPSSIIDAVDRLTRRLLPDWEVVLLTERDLERGDNGQVDLEATLQSCGIGDGTWPDAVVADIWFQTKKEDPTLARRIVEYISQNRGDSVGQHYLVSTLPEDPPHDDAFEETPHERFQFEAFKPLFHYVTNPWDEIFNHLLYVRSCHQFGTLLGRLDGTGDRETRRKLALDDFGVDVVEAESLQGRNEQEISLDGKSFSKPVIIYLPDADQPVRRLRISRCTFEKPVLVYRARAVRTIRIQRCDFHEGLVVDRCRFEEDAIFEYNRFLSEPPWFHATHFGGRITYRCNRQLPVKSESDSRPAVPLIMWHRCEFSDRGYVDLGGDRVKATWYMCSFAAGRYLEVVFPYLCEAGLRGNGAPTGNVRATATGVVDLAAHASDVDAHSGYFRFREKGQNEFADDIGFDRRDVDLRFTNSNLAGRIVIREHPFPTGYYDRRYGLGVNLSGSTLSGSLNLQHVRVRWLNLDRIAMLGGEMFLTDPGLTTRYWPKFDRRNTNAAGSFSGWITTALKRLYELNVPRLAGLCVGMVLTAGFLATAMVSSSVLESTLYAAAGTCTGLLCMLATSLLFDESTSPFSLVPERCGIIYEERLLNGLERPRFSTHLVRQNRLIEYENLLARRKLHCYSVAQQYEDLRNAFSRSPNTDAEEDYCHFKAIDYRQQAEHLTLEQNARGNAVYPLHWSEKAGVVLSIVAGALILGGVTAVGWRGVEWAAGLINGDAMAGLAPSEFLWKRFLTVTPLFASLYLLAGYALSFDVRVLCKWAARRTILQVISAGLYPTRTILSGGLIIVMFSSVYIIAGTYHLPLMGSIVDGNDIALIEGDSADVWRAMYFSVVTFTTLGYGDYHPTGALRIVAAFEALIGAIMIAIVTVSIARQYLRK